MKNAIAPASGLISGLLFGSGLLLSGMSDPQRVLGFLDLFGAWDPTLMLVMGSALAVALPLTQLATRRRQALGGAPMSLPFRRDADSRLIVGSILFGIGWGLAGLCPGPALVLLSAGYGKAIVFCASMLAGMALHHYYFSERRNHT